MKFRRRGSRRSQRRRAFAARSRPTDKHPLYQALTQAAPQAAGRPGEDFSQKLKGYGIEPNPPPEILWNFETFLIDRNGQVVARFAPDVPPDDSMIEAAIDQALGAR